MRLPAILAVSALLHAALVLWLATPRPPPAVTIEAAPVAMVFAEAFEQAAGGEEAGGGEAAAPDPLPPPSVPPPLRLAEAVPETPPAALPRAAPAAPAPVPPMAAAVAPVPPAPVAPPPVLAAPPAPLAPPPVAMPPPGASPPALELAPPPEPVPPPPVLAPPPVPPPLLAQAPPPVPPEPAAAPAPPAEAAADAPPPEAPASAEETALPPPPPAPPPMPALRLAAGLAALPALRGTPAAPPGISRGPQLRDPGCGGAFTYPEAARRLGAEGSVLLRLSVGADGAVTAAEVVQGSGFPVLDRAARESALRCRFDPALEGGRPVAGAAPWRVTYRIAP